MKNLILCLISLIAFETSATVYKQTGYPMTWSNAAGWLPSYPGTTIAAGDTVLIPTYYRLDISSGNTITINGTLIIEQFANTNSWLMLKGNANLIIGPTGKVICKDYIYMNNTSTMEVYGTVEVGGGLWETIYMQDSSSMIIHPTGVVTVEDSMYNGYQGITTTQITVNGILENNGTLYNYGNIFGTGSITSINPGNGNIVGTGYIAPGLSPGQLDIDFNLSLPATGNLNIEIGGTTPGSSYDVLGGSGNKALGGTLNVILYNGFVPNTGDEFTIVSGGNITGTFAAINYPSTPTLNWQTTYNANNVKVKVAAPTGLLETNPDPFAIYPNPVQDEFTVKGLTKGIHSYRIMDINGRVLQQGELTNEMPVRLQFDQQGLRFIEITTPQNEHVLKLLSISK